MTPAQLQRIREIATRFGCWPSDVRFWIEPFDLPDGHVMVTVGAEKGRPFGFSLNPQGDPRT